MDTAMVLAVGGSREFAAFGAGTGARLPACASPGRPEPLPCVPPSADVWRSFPLRSYHPEQSPSHQNWELNLDWAALVLG